MRNSALTLTAAVVALGSIQCGAPPDDGAPATQEPAAPAALSERYDELAPRLAALDHDLAAGARGDDVLALHAYLARHGYFPDQALRRLYPAWRPVIVVGPADPAVYDDASAHGVRALQSRFKLPVTGVVDAPTRDILRNPPCGFPESAPADSTEKYSFDGRNWGFPNPTVRWTFRNSAGNPFASTSPDPVKPAITAAFTKWAAETSITFVNVPDSTSLPTGTIIVTFSDLGSASLLARADPPNPASFAFVSLNSRASWSLANPTPTTTIDLHSTLLHEIGHTLGLMHSGYTNAVMYPSINHGQQRRSLALDDWVGISMLYDSWKQLPGGARDIAVGPNGDVWIIGTTPVTGGFQVMKWNGTGWDVAAGNRGGVHLAVDPNPGNVWITDNSGNIYMHSSNPASTTWTPMSGCGTDIGTSKLLIDLSTGGLYFVVWKIGCTADANGDRDVARAYRRSTASTPASWTVSPGARGDRISVSSSGRPWVAKYDGTILRRTVSDPTQGGIWETLPGWAWDIGVGPDDYAFMTGIQDTAFGYKIWNWDRNPFAFGLPDAPDTAAWIFFDDGGTEIAVSPRAQPYVLANDQTIWTVVK